MRETITFPRERPRPLASVLMLALVGATLLVLGLPAPTSELRGGGASPDSVRHGGMAVVQRAGDSTGSRP